MVPNCTDRKKELVFYIKILEIEIFRIAN